MSLLRNSGATKSHFKRKKEQLAKTMGLELTLGETGGADENKQDENQEKQHKSGPTVADKVPSFYHRDIERYQSKFNASIEQRQQKKLQIKKVFR
jgi:hypothetical protein